MGVSVVGRIGSLGDMHLFIRWLAPMSYRNGDADTTALICRSNLDGPVPAV